MVGLVLSNEWRCNIVKIIFCSEKHCHDHAVLSNFHFSYSDKQDELRNTSSSVSQTLLTNDRIANNVVQEDYY